MTGRRIALASGLVVFAVCALSHLDHRYLTAHMVQHLVIMTVAAPLILFGIGRRVSIHPAVCWVVGTMTVVVWHVPSIFAIGMRWHLFQHTTFLVAGLLFWVPVLYPWRAWSPWAVPLYLFFGTMPCDALSAFLTFIGRPLYPDYSLDDQGLAGALMWVWVTLAYLVPAGLVTMRLLAPARTADTLKWQQ